MTWNFISTSPKATERLAAAIGQRLRGSEVIELVSDLGGGKTAFVRGLAAGAGSEDLVSSPTFTISQIYKTPKFEIHHFDFYRLSQPGIVADELAEATAGENVVAIEWSEIARNGLPPERLKIELIATGQLSRRLIFSYPSSLAYLIPGGS